MAGLPAHRFGRSLEDEGWIAVIKTKIECDVCEIEKKETNNWVIIRTAAGSFQTFRHDSLPQRHDEDMDICGEACAHKLYSQWLSDRGVL